MQDHAAPGLLNGARDRVDIVGDQRAKVDDLGIHTLGLGGGQRDMHHGAIGDDSDVGTLAHDIGNTQRDGVIALGHFAFRMVFP